MRTAGAVLIGAVVAAVCASVLSFALYALSLTGPGAAVVGPVGDLPDEMDRPFLLQLGAVAGVLAVLLVAGAAALLVMVLRLTWRRTLTILVLEVVVATTVVVAVG